jgi:hypothetical protein
VLGAAVVAVCLATAGVYATTLTVTANQDFATTTQASPCRSSSIEVQSDKATSIEEGDPLTVAGFSATSIPADCRGTLYVSAVSTTGAQIKQFTAQLDGTATSLHFDFARPQLESALGPYAVAIH